MADLWHRAWQGAHARLVPPDLLAHRGEDHFRRLTRTRLGAMRVGVLDGRVAGFAVWTLGYLDLLFVHPAAQGRGVGSALLARAEREMAAAGIALASLDCVQGNTRAARFYESRGWTFVEEGFETVETPDAVYELPSLVFKKALV
ncbi:MAG TPA: GNAT family N-acetyltransferase [Alphaproteobacteria bacterium]|nr:GNAT family N-acetyltransferase [Alphaproteobacteria bacterium]